MLKAEAVIAYAEALKSMDGKRITGALGVIQAAYTATGKADKDLEEILGLLPNHPLYGP